MIALKSYKKLCIINAFCFYIETIKYNLKFYYKNKNNFTIFYNKNILLIYTYGFNISTWFKLYCHPTT